MAVGKAVVKVQEAPPRVRNGVYSDGKQEYTLEQLAGMPIATILRKGGKAVNSRFKIFYDKAVFKPTTITKGQTRKLFTAGVDDKDNYVNAGGGDAGWTKDEFYTNMQKDGEFPGGTRFLHLLTMVDIFLPSVKPAANGIVNGKVVNIAVNPAANTYAASLLMQALLSQFTLTLRRGGKDEAIQDGLLGDFPSSKSITGAMGAVLDGFIENAPENPFTIRLQRAQVYNPNDGFNFLLAPLADSLDISACGQDVVVKVAMAGIELTDEYGT